MSEEVVYRPVAGLTAKQAQVIALLSMGHSQRSAAKAAGVHFSTVTRWRKSDIFERAREQGIIREVQEKLGGAAAKAAEVLIGQLGNTDAPWLQQAAAREILNRTLPQHKEKSESITVQFQNMPKPGMPPAIEGEGEVE